VRCTCSTAQCVAVRCSEMQCDAVQCSAIQCDAVRCSVTQCDALRCSATQIDAVSGTAMRCIAKQAVKCCTVQSIAVQSLRCSAMRRDFAHIKLLATSEIDKIIGEVSLANSRAGFPESWLRIPPSYFFLIISSFIFIFWLWFSIIIFNNYKYTTFLTLGY
jgi:hypothetical protein